MIMPILQGVNGTGDLKRGQINIFTSPNLNNKNSDLDTYQIISRYECDRVENDDKKKHYKNFTKSSS